MSQTQPRAGQDHPPFVQYLLIYAVYTPLFAVINAIGFVAIYLTGLLGLIEPAPPQFLGVALSSFLLALSIVPSQRYLRTGRLFAGQFLLAGAASVFIAVSNLFWSGLTVFLFLVIWAPGLLQILKAESRRHWIAPILASLLGTLVLILTEIWNPFARMPFNEGASLLGFWFFIFALTVLVILILITQVIPFRTLFARFLTASLALVIVPIFIITLVSGIQTYEQEQRRTLAQLDTINTLRENQIIQSIAPIQTDLALLMQNATFLQRLEYILTVRTRTTAYQSNFNQAEQALDNFLRDSGNHQEIFVVDASGMVILSTNPAAVGTTLPARQFYTLARQSAGMSVLENRFGDIARFGAVSIMAARPIFNSQTGALIGVAGLRSGFEQVEQIMAIDAGLEEGGASYLVDENHRRLTPLQLVQHGTRTTATEQAIENQARGAGTYDSPDGLPMSGAYRWVPSLQVALITEMPTAQAVAGSIGVVTANILLGVFTVFIAGVAVFLTSLSISTPIINLSADAKKIAQGDLAVRSTVDRADEIGDLSTSFNGMAAELQSVVSGLEARIQERTRNIEQQALRLRVASEIARDATAARDLDELLERSARLIMDRFGFYHTGIFLLDQKREYAVLRSSPTKAGKDMLQNGHKLRIGAEGIVGYVSATGDARIALDTGADAIHFQNPLLPDTRSEIALPLKSNNMVIGVLDAQSDQPNAFDEEDLSILQILADQLAAAIDRTRLLKEREQNLVRLEHAYQQFTETSWRKLSGQLETPGYTFQGTALTPISQCPPEARDALKKGKLVILERHATGNERPYSVVAAPIKLRGQAIGALNIKIESDTITEDMVTTIEETAARFAIALENSRLISETQMRADRERAVSELTGRIGSSVEAHEIMRITTQELGQMLGDARVTFRLKTPTNGKTGHSEDNKP